MTVSLHEYGRACDSAGSLCALSSPDQPSFDRMIHIVEGLERKPLQVRDVAIPTILTQDMYMGAMLNMLYAPLLWAKFAEASVEIEKGNAALFMEAFDKGVTADVCETKPDSSSYLESQLAIICSDSSPLPVNMTLEEFRTMGRDSLANITSSLHWSGFGYVKFMPWYFRFD